MLDQGGGWRPTVTMRMRIVDERVEVLGSVLLVCLRC